MSLVWGGSVGLTIGTSRLEWLLVAAIRLPHLGST